MRAIRTWIVGKAPCVPKTSWRITLCSHLRAKYEFIVSAKTKKKIFEFRFFFFLLRSICVKQMHVALMANCDLRGLFKWIKCCVWLSVCCVDYTEIISFYYFMSNSSNRFLFSSPSTPSSSLLLLIYLWQRKRSFVTVLNSFNYYHLSLFFWSIISYSRHYYSAREIFRLLLLFLFFARKYFKILYFFFADLIIASICMYASHTFMQGQSITNNRKKNKNRKQKKKKFPNSNWTVKAKIIIEIWMYCGFFVHLSGYATAIIVGPS